LIHSKFMHPMKNLLFPVILSLAPVFFSPLMAQATGNNLPWQKYLNDPKVDSILEL